MKGPPKAGDHELKVRSVVRLCLFLHHFELHRYRDRGGGELDLTRVVGLQAPLKMRWEGKGRGCMQRNDYIHWPWVMRGEQPCCWVMRGERTTRGEGGSSGVEESLALGHQVGWERGEVVVTSAAWNWHWELKVNPCYAQHSINGKNMDFGMRQLQPEKLCESEVVIDPVRVSISSRVKWI